MPRPNQAVAVRHPESGAMIVPDQAIDYPASDPLVREYPWLFEDKDPEPALRESAPIERATQAPGERRHGTRRPRR